MKTFKIAAFALAMIAIPAAGIAQSNTTQTMPMNKPMMMTPAEKAQMTSCMGMSHDMMMKDMKCMAMMKNMKMSNDDMAMMTKCHAMSEDMMKKDMKCMEMKKMHSDMMSMPMKK